MDPELTLRRLLDGPDEPSDTTSIRRALGRNLGEFMDVSTADSIFRALGYPLKPVVVGSTVSPTAAAEYDPQTQQITISGIDFITQVSRAAKEAIDAGYLTRPDHDKYAREVFGAGYIPGILAHEIAHQETLNEDFDFDAKNPQIAGLLNLFLGQYEDLPRERRASAFAEYLGVPVQQLAERYGRFRDSDTERAEIFAKTLERGFEVARRADSRTPEQHATEVESAEERLPGTRAAVNFWIRSWLGENP